MQSKAPNIIGTREGERANTPSPRPSEARLIAQGKARRLTLRAEIWSTLAEFYPPHLPPPFCGDEVAGSPFLQPHLRGTLHQ